MQDYIVMLHMSQVKFCRGYCGVNCEGPKLRQTLERVQHYDVYYDTARLCNCLTLGESAAYHTADLCMSIKAAWTSCK